MVAHNLGKTIYPKGAFFSGWQVEDKLITKNVANIIDINNSYTFFIAKRNRFKNHIGL